MQRRCVCAFELRCIEGVGASDNILSVHAWVGVQVRYRNGATHRHAMREIDSKLWIVSGVDSMQRMCGTEQMAGSFLLLFFGWNTTCYVIR